MAEYIEREALLEVIDEMISNISFSSPYQNEISPTVIGMERVRDCVYDADVVNVAEVIRCKECRFIINREDRTHGCYRHFVEDCKPDDFCSYGERK